MCLEANNLAILADLATIFAVPIATIGLIYAGLQLRHSARTAKGQFLLQIEEQSNRHDAVHRKLYPDGDWGVNIKGAPTELQEWGLVADYLGFFEQCESLIRNGCLDKSTFRKIYGDRVHNILDNPVIVEEKLQGDTRSTMNYFCPYASVLAVRSQETPLDLSGEWPELADFRPTRNRFSSRQSDRFRLKRLTAYFRQ